MYMSDFVAGNNIFFGRLGRARSFVISSIYIQKVSTSYF